MSVEIISGNCKGTDLNRPSSIVEYE